MKKAAIFLLFCSFIARSLNAEIIVVPPAKTVFSGERSVFTVFVFNTEEESIEINLPDELICQLISPNEKTTAYATALPSNITGRWTLKKNSFSKKQYKLTIPNTDPGPVRFRVEGLVADEVMFAVAKGPAPTVQKGIDPDEPLSDEYPSLAALFSLYQPYAVNFTAYEPVYFLIGADPKDSKFQISFKYQFFNKDNSITEDLPWLKGIFFGYTQTSFWNLKSDSAPFEDTIYRPEVFYLSNNLQIRSKWLKGLFLQTGFQHESNGRGGDVSRSTNFAYLKPYAIFYNEKRKIGMLVSPKIWAYINNDDETNPDLEDYKGYFNLEIKFGKQDSFVFGSTFWWAREGASGQFDVTYPLHHLFSNNFDLYLQAQYVDALAERFIDYKERNRAFRLGVAIVR